VTIGTVVANGPADKEGSLLQGDIIRGVDGVVCGSIEEVTMNVMKAGQMIKARTTPPNERRLTHSLVCHPTVRPLPHQHPPFLTRARDACECSDADGGRVLYARLMVVVACCMHADGGRVLYALMVVACCMLA
jgi:hypothetical protein